MIIIHVLQPSQLIKNEPWAEARDNLDQYLNLWTSLIKEENLLHNLGSEYISRIGIRL